jgi:class 3 adenylate cyclase
VIANADVRESLPRITAPTLVLHRKDAVMIPASHGRFLAEHIAGSRYVELPGADTLHWTGDAAPLLDEIEEFVTGTRGGSDAERALTTIVFTDIVGSTQRAAELGDVRWHDLPCSRRAFSERGQHDLKGVPGRWRVYAVCAV